MTLTGFALSSVEQVVDGGSESFGLFFTGEVQTDLTGLRGRGTGKILVKATLCGDNSQYDTNVIL